MMKTLKSKLAALSSSVTAFMVSKAGFAQDYQVKYGMQPLYGVIQPEYGMPVPAYTFWDKALYYISRPITILLIACFLAVGIYLLLRAKKGHHVRKPEKSGR